MLATVVLINPEILIKSPDFSKSAVAVDAEPHGSALPGIY
jgi:hypothetical protein